jgi:hypothetical protein
VMMLNKAAAFSHADGCFAFLEWWPPARQTSAKRCGILYHNIREFIAGAGVTQGYAMQTILRLIRIKYGCRILMPAGDQGPCARPPADFSANPCTWNRARSASR